MVKHFLDSILLLPELEQGDTLIDVGTGAGFPGVPLKILRPGLHLTLLDSLNKRLIFLREVLDRLGLDAQIVHARAEEGGRQAGLRTKIRLRNRAGGRPAELAVRILPAVFADGRRLFGHEGAGAGRRSGGGKAGGLPARMPVGRRETLHPAGRRRAQRGAHPPGKAPGGGLSAPWRKDFQKPALSGARRAGAPCGLPEETAEPSAWAALPLWEGFPTGGAARGKGEEDWMEEMSN